MVALDASFMDLPHARVQRWRGSAVGTLCAVAACASIGLIVLERQGESTVGLHAASQAVFRASSFIFLIWFISEPMAGLLPYGPSGIFGRERESFLLAFVASYATFLVFLIGPLFLSELQIPIETLFFTTVAVLVGCALVWSTHRRGPRLLGDAGWRRADTFAMGYFWLVYVVADVTHLYGPHRPDRFYGISILCLIGALLLRFAAALVRKTGRAGRHRAILSLVNAGRTLPRAVVLQGMPQSPDLTPAPAREGLDRLLGPPAVDAVIEIADGAALGQAVRIALGSEPDERRA